VEAILGMFKMNVKSIYFPLILIE